jgi:hypothetical protein
VDVRGNLAPSPKVWTTDTIPGKALLLHGRRRHQLLNGVIGGQRERAQKLAVVQEVDPQHLFREDQTGPLSARSAYFCWELKMSVTVTMKPVGSPFRSSGW